MLRKTLEIQINSVLDALAEVLNLWEWKDRAGPAAIELEDEVVGRYPKMRTKLEFRVYP